MKASAQLVILALALGTTVLAVLSFPFMNRLEWPAGDLLQSLRYSIMSEADRRVGCDSSICLVGIDGPTLERLGKFQSGEWLVRRPFLSFVHAMERDFSPRTLAFDILFQPVLGGEFQGESRGADMLGQTLGALHDQVVRQESSMSSALLFDISQTISYLAEYHLAAGFAGLKWPLNDSGRTGVPVLCGYYFPYETPDVSGDGNADRRMPPSWERAAYLLDVALDPKKVDEPPADFPFARAVDLPASVLLDYSRLGFINVPRDPDGIMRRVPLVWGAVLPTENGVQKCYLPSFALLAYLDYRGLKTTDVLVEFGESLTVQTEAGTPLLDVPIDDYGRMFLDFDCRIQDVDSVSMVDVLAVADAMDSDQADATKTAARHRRLKSMIDDRLCLVGLVAPGTTDIGPTPIDPNTPFVQVHLTALKNMFSHRLMRPLRAAERTGVLVLVGLIFALVAYLPRISTFLWGALGVFSTYLALCYALVHWHVAVLPVVTPVLQMSLAFVSILFVRYWTEERAKRRIRSMFSTMVSMEVLRYMEEHPESFALKGNRVQATVMFSDINRFTSIAEKLDPDSLSELLNRYFSTMTEAIMESGGYVDKFEGDAIMAEWGVPYPDSEHAVTACRAVLAQREVLNRLNPELADRFGVTFSVRFGLCSGELSAGNMGSQKKFQYTVMGNVVNQAARLEPLNKIYGTEVIVGEETRRLAGSNFEFRLLDRVVMAGMTEPMNVYELLGEPGRLAHARLGAVKRYEEALDLYRHGQWDEAESLFSLVVELNDDDPPSRAMIKRIQRYRETPPQDGWNGVCKIEGKP